MDDWRESVLGRADVITGKRSGTFGVECELGSVREHSRVYLIWRVVYCCLHVGANHTGPVSGVELNANGCEFMVNSHMNVSMRARRVSSARVP